MMIDRTKLEARLDAALARAKAARSDGQRAENEALDLMIQIGTYSARKAEAERDAAVARAEAAEAESRRLRDAVERAVEHLTISVPGMRLTLAEPSASLARDVLAAALADA